MMSLNSIEFYIALAIVFVVALIITSIYVRSDDIKK